MASNQIKSNPEESLIEHKIVVICQKIKIQLTKSARCTIRYEYPLFGSNEFISDTFPIKPLTNDSQEIPPFWEHIVPPNLMNEGDLKTFLKNHHLSIKLFEKDTHLGTVTINLARVYDPESQKRNQQSFKEYMNIMSSDAEKVIGTMECLIVLVKESCTRCKFCSKIKKDSVIRKHIGQSTKCKNAYSEEEMNFLVNQSKKRKIQMDVTRNREKYDTKKRKQYYDSKKRSERHKNTYDSKERNIRYQREKEEDEEFEEKSTKQTQTRMEIETNVKKSKEYNSKGRDLTNKRFHCGSEMMDCLKLDRISKLKVKFLENRIEELYNQIDIQEAIDEANNLGYEGAFLARIDDVFKEFNIKVCNRWHELQLKIDIEFKAIATNMGESFSCQYERDYCPLYCWVCSKEHYCQDHKMISETHKHAIWANQRLRKQTNGIFDYGLNMIKQLSAIPVPTEIIKKMQADIVELYETFDNEICEIFKNAPLSCISYIDELPLKKQLCENWHGLQIEIDSKFYSIAKQQDESVAWKIDQCYCTNICGPCKKSDKCMDHLKCRKP